MSIIPLEGMLNLRDFGDRPTRSRRRVVAGRLYRGGHQGRVTPSDAEILDDLDIGLIVDLRRSFEWKRVPRVWPASGGIELMFDTSDSSAETLDYVSFLRDPALTPSGVLEHVRHAYRTIPYDPIHVELYSAYLNRLQTLDRASLVSCTHGKDRTGILCAVLLHLLGVDRESILEDYMLTNEGLGRGAVEEAQQAFAATYDIALTSEVMATVVRVHESYLDTAFDEMKARNGSIDGYLDSLGIDEEKRASLRERFVH